MIKSIRNISGTRLGNIFLVGLSFSIGWGIRGNYGHEYGAAFAGALGTLAVVLVSGREDWRKRIPWFALFGALGWGFGASQSYMQVISYVESGQVISQAYGYIALFWIGFLWAAMGGAGTAFAAVATRERLVNIFKPLLFLWGAWLLLDLIEDPVAKLMQEGINFDSTWFRHKNPLYWFDADYLPALFVLIAMWAYDLYNRKGEHNRFCLPLFAAGGALSGWLVQLIMRFAGIESKFASALTYLQGDPSYIDPATGQHAYEASNLLNNWPQWFGDYPHHVGWFIGLILGITAYFLLFGKFRNGSSLIAWMGSGWLISFLVFPVLGSLFFTQYGGLRMTPPRSDDWAGITGVFFATILWMWRNNLRPVAVAAIISGTIGGVGIIGMEWLKQLMLSFGSPRILAAKGILPGSDAFNQITSKWANWQSQNWHSFFEQTYGFINGIAIAVALGFLASRIKIHSDNDEITSKASVRWTTAFSVLFVLLGLTYFNVVKNVDNWSSTLDPKVWKEVVTQANGTTETISAKWDMPIFGRLPGIDFLHTTPLGWFNLTWALLTLACIMIVMRHYKKPLPIIPQGPLAKGQVIFLILLWIMVVANFERVLPGWAPQRLLTEWVIFVNAILATVLVILLPKEQETVTILEEQNYKLVYKRLLIKGVLVLIISSSFFWSTNQMIYHAYPKIDEQFQSGYQTRFGPNASWKSHPNLKNEKSK